MTWHNILAIDFDKWAAATYAANFPGVEVRCASVADEIDRLPDADVMLGGPPCQPHSYAGKRLASVDARDCGPDFVAAVAKVRPRMFLMENVVGLLSSENGRYWHRLYASMEGAGYVVQYRVQDAVSFGVPQFRSRLWVWGIRRDLYADGIRHCWPVPTHAWPPPQTPCMFGAGLLPGVTVGEALGLEGMPHRRRGKSVAAERRDHPTGEPSPCITSAFALGGGGGLFLIQPEAEREDEGKAVEVRRVRETDRPQAGRIGLCEDRQGAGGGCGVPPRLSPEGANDAGGADDSSVVGILDAQNDTVHGLDEPIGTIQGNAQAKGGGTGHHAVHAYRWSDAMLQKHSPASPAPTILGKFYKGGAEGLLRIDDPKHPVNTPDRPAVTQRGGGNGHSAPDHTKQKRTRRSVDQPATTVAHDSRHHLDDRGIYIRRLTPLECLRLQSGPDDFRWPEKISKTASFKVVGDGWACGHAAHFSRALRAADPDSRTVIDLYCGGGLGACGFHGRFWALDASRKAVPA